MTDEKYVLLYSEQYADLLSILPEFSVKVLVDKETAVIFRVTAVPSLLIYEGLIEVGRIVGTKRIRTYLHEKSNSRGHTTQ